MTKEKQKKNTTEKRMRPCIPKSDRITKKEALSMLKNADLLDLGLTADNMRNQLHPEKIVTFVVDRTSTIRMSASINARSVRSGGTKPTRMPIPLIEIRSLQR